MAKDLKERTKVAVLWNIFNIVFSKTSRLLTSIVLARILFPEDFGLYGVSLIVIRFGRRLTNFGFSTVLIQKKEIDKSEVNTVFTASLVINLTVFVILFFGAPYFAAFVHNDRVVNLVRVISTAFVLNTFIMVAESLLKRDLNFKAISISRSVRSVSNNIIAITLAILNFGVWSLIGGEIIAVVINLVLIMIYSRWTPQIYFKFSIFKRLYSYGMRVSFVQYLNYFINNIDYLLISRFLGMTALGYYERAFNLMDMTRRQIGRSMNEALFSAFSRIKEDEERVAKNLKQVLNYTSLIAYPILIGLIFLAPSVVYNLYGPKWEQTIVPLQIMSVSGLFNTIITAFFPVIFAMDFINARIKAQAVYLILLTGMIYASISYGINGVAMAVVVSSVVYGVLILRVIVKKLPFTMKDFWQTQKAPFIYSLFQIGLSFLSIRIFTPYFKLTSIPMFFILASSSVIAFLLAHLIFRFPAYSNLLKEFTGMILKTKKPAEGVSGK
ncbi:MAG: lipopolysaccharide biosynthesis protein [Calditrichaeota bacterium]|nr:lipopolysaccharide biosynthesis protein [Calditrichota bacterium]